VQIFLGGFPRNFVPSFLGVELLDLPLISLKAFETARLVMGRRNVDFDEEAAILEHVLPKVKMAKIAVSKS
jgi:hypothetical protein